MKTLLKNGMLYDGTGAAPYAGSLIVEGGMILEVLQGPAPETFDGQVVDCAGRAVAPGFIDAHSHNDWFAARHGPAPYLSLLRAGYHHAGVRELRFLALRL